MKTDKHLPGSDGEHALQKSFDTELKAKDFYDRQMLEYLAEYMQEFIKRQEMVFISTSDKNGECDSSFRSGEAGFVQVINEKLLIYPDFKGNGVLASAGNISENPHIGLLFIDFFKDKVGLHVNGKAKVVNQEELSLILGRETLEVNENFAGKISFWVVIDVEEAYIHCSKNIPVLQKGSSEGKKYPIDYFKLQSN